MSTPQSRMKLCNIKVSASFKKPFHEKQKNNKKVKQKVRNFTFIRYLHSPHLVNITGIRSRKEIEDAIQILQKENDNTCIGVKIDSCMFSHKDNQIIKLEDIAPFLSSVTNLYYVDYQPELFPGCYLKPYDRGYPTINIFYTSSFQLMGGKSFKKIEESMGIARQVIKLCQNKNKAETLYKRHKPASP